MTSTKTIEKSNTKKASKKWSPAVSGQTADKAMEISRYIADKMLEGEVLAECIYGLSQQGDLTSQWDSFGLMAGFGGLVAMYNQLDRCFPGEGWRRVSTHFLKISADMYSKTPTDEGSLCSGGSGLGYVALQAAKSKTSTELLTVVNKNLKQNIKARVQEVEKADGLKEGQFDALYGIAGCGRYLLASGSKKQPADNLMEMLRVLVGRSREKNGVPMLYTPRDLLHPMEQENFLHDIVNCGLAHGVPGPLVILSLALKAGYEIDGLRESVEFWSGWLKKNHIRDEWGTNWTGAIYMNNSEQAASKGTRAAWCYGVPGVARSLYIAGDALGDSELMDFAADAMLSVFKRPEKVQNSSAPTMCHGRAGVLQVTMRFFNATGLPEFQQEAEKICQELVDRFDQSKVWGYTDPSPGGEETDSACLLTGAAGVALALLSAACPVEPVWDQVFLLS